MQELNFSLSILGLRGALTEILKMFRGIDNANVSDYQVVDGGQTSGNDYTKTLGSKKSKYFRLRVANVWNTTSTNS